MADFFTLNPRYERYELGVYPLEYKTVNGRDRPFVGHTVLVAILSAGILIAIITFCRIKGLRTYIDATTADNLITLVIYAAVILAIVGEIYSYFFRSRGDKRYNDLVSKGVMLNGTIKNIAANENRYTYRNQSYELKEHRDTYSVHITYTFTTPDQRMITGEQTRDREDLRDKPLPPVGTPIRVLYVDDHTHVML